MLGWLTKSPTAFGFAGELWTSRRGVRFNANYLVEWLTARRHSAQKPESCAKERDEAAVARWLAEDWPRIQKKPTPRAPTSCSSTKAASV